MRPVVHVILFGAVEKASQTASSVCMKLYFYFLCEDWRTNWNLRHIVYGRYSKVGFAFMVDGKLSMFGTNQSSTFSILTSTEGCTVDFLYPDIDEETTEKIFRTCDACVQSKIPFNLADLLLMFAPLPAPEEIPLFECKTLNNVQAFLLILRECLPLTHKLYQAMHGLNSRQCLVDSVYEVLSPCATTILYSQLMNQNAHPTDSVH